MVVPADVARPVGIPKKAPQKRGFFIGIISRRGDDA
jgi:hypothetical protein